MKIQSFASLAGLLVLVAGCANIPSVGPNYHPPQTATPTNWSEPQLGGATNSPVQIVEWWKTFNDPELDSLVERVMKANYNLRLAVAHLHESRATVSGAEWDFAPVIGTSAGLQSVSASDLFNASSHYWSVGPTVTWRIFDYGRIHAQIKGANARQEQALDTYQQTVLTAFQDVENALVAFANEQARYQALNESVIANRRSLEIANELYTSGNGDFLNVLDSERSLFAAEDQLVDSQRTMTENLVTLYKALGGGWEIETKALAMNKAPQNNLHGN